MFVKNIKVHDGPVEDLAFERFFLRLASAGAGYPQVWGLGTYISFVHRLVLMLHRVIRVLLIESPHPNSDYIHTFARVYMLLTKVKA